MSTRNYDSQVPNAIKGIADDRLAELRLRLRQSGGDDGSGLSANEVYNLSPDAVRAAVDEYGVLDRAGLIREYAQLTDSNPSSFGRSGDARMLELEQLSLVDRQAALYGGSLNQ